MFQSTKYIDILIVVYLSGGFNPSHMGQLINLLANPRVEASEELKFEKLETYQAFARSSGHAQCPKETCEVTCLTVSGKETWTIWTNLGAVYVQTISNNMCHRKLIDNHRFTMIYIHIKYKYNSFEFATLKFFRPFRPPHLRSFSQSQAEESDWPLPVEFGVQHDRQARKGQPHCVLEGTRPRRGQKEYPKQSLN